MVFVGGGAVSYERGTPVPQWQGSLIVSRGTPPCPNAGEQVCFGELNPGFAPRSGWVSEFEWFLATLKDLFCDFEGFAEM